MRRAVLLLLTLLPPAVLAAPPLPSPARIDAEAQRLMQAAHARGMALAVIDGGRWYTWPPTANATPQASHCAPIP